MCVGLQHNLIGLEKDIDKIESMTAVFLTKGLPLEKDDATGKELQALLQISVHCTSFTMASWFAGSEDGIRYNHCKLLLFHSVQLYSILHLFPQTHINKIHKILCFCPRPRLQGRATGSHHQPFWSIDTQVSTSALSMSTPESLYKNDKYQFQTFPKKHTRSCFTIRSNCVSNSTSRFASSRNACFLTEAINLLCETGI